MIKCLELNREFDSKAEMFKALKANKDNIINFKKSIVYKSIDKAQLSGFVDKSNVNKSIEVKENFIAPVINTTDFIDSHLDCHQKGIWNKSIKEQQGKIRYSLDHSPKVADVIAYPKDVNIRVEEISFKDLGYDYLGKTQALIFDINKDVIDNPTALKVITKGLPVQNSVSMQYVKIELAVDSEEKEYKEEKKLWDSSINSVANKEVAEESGYYWLVYEAKIVNESSMVTLGSNSATPILYETVQHDKALETEAEKSLREKQAADKIKKDYLLKLLEK